MSVFLFCLEFFDQGSCVDKFLVSCIEWVAFMTQLDMDLFLRRSGRKLIAANAYYLRFVIKLRVYCCFHVTIITEINPIDKPQKGL